VKAKGQVIVACQGKSPSYLDLQGALSSRLPGSATLQGFHCLAGQSFRNKRFLFAGFYALAGAFDTSKCSALSDDLNAIDIVDFGRTILKRRLGPNCPIKGRGITELLFLLTFNLSRNGSAD
jgi:hypothetical protein